jgi:hypothetical protein
MRALPRHCWLPTLLLFLTLFSVRASGSDETHALAEVDHADLGHGHHRHHASLFLGGATRFEDHHDETGLAIGVDYEYRVNKLWGVMGLFEGVVTDHSRETVLLAGVAFHPYQGLRLGAGPGVEFSHGSGEFAFRLGAAYGFELGRWTLSPELAGDFTRESETLVFGVSLGRGF